jgi:hypothetical protein
MTKEILHGDASGLTLYFQLVSQAGAYWNGSALEAYSASHWANNAIAMTETASTGQYFGNMPAVASGNYRAVVYLQVGSSPAIGDPIMESRDVPWDGSAVPTVQNLKTKKDLIVVGGITVTSPLSSNGDVLTLVAGDDYYNAHGRAIEFVSADFPSLSGATCLLRIISRDTNAVVFSIDGTIVDAQTVRFELPRDKTSLLAAAAVGTYVYSMRVVFSDGQIATEKRGQLLVLNG